MKKKTNLPVSIGSPSSPPVPKCHPNYKEASSQNENGPLVIYLINADVQHRQKLPLIDAN